MRQIQNIFSELEKPEISPYPTVVMVVTEKYTDVK
jgi:hypothetical protein